MPAPLRRVDDFDPSSSSANDMAPYDIHAHYDSNLAYRSISYPNTRPRLHLLPANLYNVAPPLHQVWILDCSSCGKFITNRGMKAVLLLRPNISLYSSDAFPSNCSAYSSNTGAPRAASTCRPSHLPPRTCECLTQALCCHGCGTNIGYMIVIPCQRCTASITSSNRATNGHRFVFHATELTGTPRHYIHDEPGVIAYDPFTTGPLAPLPTQLANADQHYSRVAPPPHAVPFIPPHYTAPSMEYLPTPPPEIADLSPVSSSTPDLPVEEALSQPSSPNWWDESRSPDSHHLRSSPTLVLAAPNTLGDQPHSEAFLRVRESNQSRPIVPSSYISPQEHCRKLKTGDLVFWHHLSRCGEIPGLVDDIRARKPVQRQMANMLFCR